MKITPLAAESMGTRSMATFVESDDFRLLIDPGVSLAGVRYHMPPHSLEKWRLGSHRERIRLFADKAHAVIITCFHSDHCSDDIDIYKKKLIFMQNPNVGLDVSRRKKAFHLLNQIKGLPRDIIYMNARTFQLGPFRIHFSKPVENPNEEKKEPVIPVIIKDKTETFFFSSNIEGIFPGYLLQWVLRNRPTFMYMDGPVTYHHTAAEKSQRMQCFYDSMKALFQQTFLKTIILDHHITRDYKYRQKIKPLDDLARIFGALIHTAAEYRGEENDFLEARRQILYSNDSSKKT
jgi:predicted metallo-beta-lactamase superfamily hydrolase